MSTDAIKRAYKLGTQHCFIFGPRGTGKSTLLKQCYGERALFIDLLKPAVWRQYQANPEHLEAVVSTAQYHTVIIEEIEKLPQLLDVIHDLIEQKLAVQFILTGSSCRKLKQTGVDLLAGRAIEEHLHPFIAAELGDKFDLEQILQFGLLPLVYSSTNKQKTLNTYISLYLCEEVHSEGLVRNIGNFTRFLEVICFSHGSQLNYTNVARECQVSRKSVEAYVAVLSDLLLASTLPVFTKRAQRAVVSHPKFYYFDVGVYRSLRTSGRLDIASEIDSAGLEGLVFQHLRAWNDYRNTPFNLYYWRTRHGVEVDFIVYGSPRFYAIEVKNSAFVHDKDVKGLRSFCSDYPEAIPLLLYRGEHQLRVQGVLCVPVGDFLLQLNPQTNDLWQVG